MKRRHRPSPAPEPILTVAEMAAVDARAADTGLSVLDLMRAAGQAVADAVDQEGPVAVLCGPGNNGGDGYVAASILAARGRDVVVHADRPPSSNAVAVHAARWIGSLRPLAECAPKTDMVVVDALFGAGLARPIAGAAGEAIARLNASEAYVVAVDVPSGLDGDGAPPIGPVVEANRTVTFFRSKPAHWLWPGRRLCGELIVADIGLTHVHLDPVARPRLFLNGLGLWAAAVPDTPLEAHKYQRGHCLIVSGPPLRTGASRLAATAALYAGAGAATIAGTRDALLVHASHLTAIMLAEAEGLDDFERVVASGHYSAAVIGPAAGIGADTLARLTILTQAACPTVVDADALTSLVGRLDVLVARPAGAPVVLTPHEGEFARLFAGEPEVKAARTKVERACAAARLADAVIVLKGIDTVIAAPDGRAAIEGEAGPELATAGSGDVLSGIVAAHMARGMPAFESAAAGVHLHAACGARHGVGLTADRLVELVRPLEAIEV